MHRLILEVFLALVFLTYSCKGQVIPYEEQISLLLKTLNSELAALQDGHKRIEESLLMVQSEIAEIKVFSSSLKFPSCKDDIRELQNLLSTDECIDGTHNCSEHAKCTDKLSGFTCSCLPGHSGDGVTCLDIDECMDKDICGDHASCTNVGGSYKCQCSDGYEMENNGCQDIDECTRDLNECQVPATCVNTEGSYQCQCLPPFKGDPLKCERECLEPSLYVEGLGCITPMFTRLRWEEAKRVCEESGGRLLEDIQNSHFKAISQHFKPLMNDRPYPWVGFKNNVWVSSGRPVSMKTVASQEGELEGECGNVDLRMFHQGLWDADCFDEEFALCQKI
ncbi:pro-epidermal growth factor-like [Palaemon carinicauda]|uniref:pro-epidermal growth factor-like n=1 Tax=Palaemon carinicauda TaxID=392227 RepID=UPI0035B5C9DA